MSTTKKLELHALLLSPPSRAVHMALDLLGLDYDYVHVDVLGGGTRTPEFLSMNPQHTVPVLVDGNHVITGEGRRRVKQSWAYATSVAAN